MRALPFALVLAALLPTGVMRLLPMLPVLLSIVACGLLCWK
jgi:hypothetical protein